MDKQNTAMKAAFHVIIGIFIFVVFAGLAKKDYLIFHSLIEVFDAIILMSIFVVSVHTYRVSDNHYIAFLGIALGFLGFFSILNMLAYQGMDVFSGQDANLPTQLWIMTRYMIAISFALAPLFIQRPLHIGKALLCYIAVSLALLLSIFWLDIFPVCYVDGVGLTLFKKISEYIIAGIFVLAIYHTYKYRSAFDGKSYQYIILAVIASIVGELLSTLYIDFYAFFNFLGHIFILISNLFVFRVFVVSSLVKPAQMMFYNIAQLNERLIAELGERKKAQQDLQRTNRILKVLREFNQALMRFNSIILLQRAICNILVSTGGYRMAWIGAIRRDEACSVEPVAISGYEEDFLKLVKISWANSERGQGPIGRAIRSKKPCFFASLATDPEYVLWREEALKRGYASSISLPVCLNDEVVYVLNIYAGEENAFDEEEISLLSELTGDLAYGVEALLTKRERDKAHLDMLEKDEHLRRAILYAPFPAAIHAEDGEFILMSGIWSELTGYSPEDIPTTTEWIEKAFGHKQDLARAYIDRLYEAAEKNYYKEHHIKTASGDVRIWNISSAYLGKLPDGRRVAISMAMDVTERHAYQEQLRNSEEHYRMLFDSMTDGYVLHEMVYDEKGDPCDFKFIDINPALEKQLGINRSECIGKNVREVLPEIDKRFYETINGVVLSGQTKRFENYLEAIGKYFEICVFRPIENHFSLIFTDITARKELENLIYQEKERLRESEEKYRLLIENQTDLIVKTDLQGRYLYASPSYCRLFGKKEEELLGETYVPLVHKDDLPVVQQAIESMSQPPYSCSYEERAKTILGWRWIEWDASAVLGEQGEVIASVGAGRDITERKRKEEEIAYLYNHDILTGLYNRAYFEEEKKRLDCKRQMPLSVVVGDINGLKLINDAFGYAEGDKILAEVAKILKKSCRSRDIVARVGGDEFCILLPQTGSDTVQTIVRQIYEDCASYKEDTGREIVYPSIALGYATKLNTEESLTAVLKESEEVMYKHKLLEHKSFHSNIVASIKSTMFEKSHETEEHANRLVSMSKMMGKLLSLSDDRLDELELLSLLHDIGKMSIDDHVLNKPEALTDEEWIEMKKHPEVGCRIAQATPELLSIADYILTHHERWDGSGYPQGLSGEAIPLLSRILAIIDTYDAMTQDRPYRKALSQKMAVAEIAKNTGTQFDPALARLFIEEVVDKLPSLETQKNQKLM